MKKKVLFMVLFFIFLMPSIFISAQNQEGHYIAAFYYTIDLSKDSGFIILHTINKQEIIKDISLIKFLEDMRSKNWSVIQSNRAPSKTGDYECVYVLFEKKK
jgi:hypothetical protein